MNWLKQALTGADNSTIAIGRLMGALLFALLICVVAYVVWAVGTARAPAAEWVALLGPLGLFVLTIIGSITGLIRVTSTTEPQPKTGDSANV